MFLEEISSSNFRINSGNISWKTLEFSDKIGPIFISELPEFFQIISPGNSLKCLKDGSIFCKRMPEFIQKIDKRNILNNLSKISGNFPEKLNNIFENFGQFRDKIRPIFRGIYRVLGSEVRGRSSLMCLQRECSVLIDDFVKY